MRRLSTAAAAALWILVVVALGLRTHRLSSPPQVVDEARWALQDFRDAVHGPAAAMLAGVNPYDAGPYRAHALVGQDYPLYSPGHLLLHAPFALLPLEVARIVWFAVQLGLATLLARAALCWAGIEPRLGAVLGCAALLLASRPGHMNQVVGNLAWEMALATCAALALAPSHPRLAGLCLALTTGKPTFGAPLGMLMLLAGQRRAVGWGLLFSALLIAGGVACIAIFGDDPAALLAAIRENHLSPATRVGVKPVHLSWARVDLSALFSYSTGRAPSAGVQAGFAAALLGLAGLALRSSRLSVAPEPAQRSAGAGAAGPGGTLIVLTVLLTLYHQAYDVVVLGPAFLAVAASLFTRADSGAAAAWGERPRALRVLLLGLLALPFVNYLATATFLARSDSHSAPLRALILSANGAALFLAWILVWIQVWRRGPERPEGAA